MTKKQQRSLDAWILRKFKIENATVEKSRALALLEKLGSEDYSIACKKTPSGWKVSKIYWDSFEFVEEDGTGAKTLPLAICLFAKEIYGRQ